MTPDEARKGCDSTLCRTATPASAVAYACHYHGGYEDGYNAGHDAGWRMGYEAAQRERGPIQAVGKPLPTHAEWCTGPVGYGGVGACPCDPIATTAIHRLYASETPQGRPGS